MIVLGGCIDEPALDQPQRVCAIREPSTNVNRFGRPIPGTCAQWVIKCHEPLELTAAPVMPAIGSEPIRGAERLVCRLKQAKIQ
jgi:hypothetical protein